ncbi:hypothetical protein STRTUCAR8_02414 [Streptomyces turgidiscabies Car8]|uniref:Uncharacterized protein n=1 Tax=Streptomyces turgidiscabies (strain Car8) TaxID=698760 RepID=L7FIZ8_STRT8|nr:hypothetical protein STRTUCAR8_02414 [Streptomyces turgidiscabies Car8]
MSAAGGVVRGLRAGGGWSRSSPRPCRGAAAHPNFPAPPLVTVHSTPATPHATPESTP